MRGCVQRPGPSRSRSGWCSRVEHQLRRPAWVGTASVLLLVGMERAPPHRAGRPGTLLGPEGTARQGRLLHDGPGRSDEPPAPFRGAGRRRRTRLGDRSLFENCTVDASVGSGERQRMMAKPVLCDTCQGLRCRCCGVLQDWSDSWSPVACGNSYVLVLSGCNHACNYIWKTRNYAEGTD
jgi:hypothetical protein